MVGTQKRREKPSAVLTKTKLQRHRSRVGAWSEMQEGTSGKGEGDEEPKTQVMTSG